MNGNDLLDKMELVDDSLVEAAGSAGRTSRRKNIIRGIEIAAATIVVCAAGAFGIRYLITSQSGSHTQQDSGMQMVAQIERDYKTDLTYSSSDAAVVWPWEYLTTAEKYTKLTIGDTVFYSRRMLIDPAKLGDVMGEYSIMSNVEEHLDESIQAEAYMVNDVSPDLIVAVELDNAFYIFISEVCAEYKSLGDIFDVCDLDKVLELEEFSKYEGYDSKGSYKLDDDAYIWEVLRDKSDAVAVDFESVRENIKGNITFTATSDSLGIYKRAIYISRSGYLAMNIFDVGYTFDIGTEASEAIISYAMANGKETEMKPYYEYNTLVGTITEIADGYFTVDDSALCKDANDGMTFKITGYDITVNRYFDLDQLKVGDTVMVMFTGDVDTESGNVIDDVADLAEVYIDGNGGVLIEE